MGRGSPAAFPPSMSVFVKLGYIDIFAATSAAVSVSLQLISFSLPVPIALSS